MCRRFRSIEVFRPLVQDADNPDHSASRNINQRVGEAPHDTFARSLPNARTKHQTEGSDLFCLIEDRIHRTEGYRLASCFEIPYLDGLDVPPSADGILKPLFWHDA